MTSRTNWQIIVKGITPLKNQYDEGEIDFVTMRDGVVAILRRRLKARLDPNHDRFDSEVYEAVEYLAETSDDDMFNDAQSDLYDWCDANLVWIDPID